MCGVFGFVSYDGEGPKLETLRKIAAETQSRGEHAFGFAWLDWAGRLKMFKRAGKITDYLALLSMARDARVLVGHCRWATHGDPKNNTNNHPHPADGGWIVHNGVVTNHEQLTDEYDLHPVSACDSEVLGLLIAAQAKGSLVERCVATVAQAKGRVTMLGVWSHPARLVAIRADNPLCVGEVKGGRRFYLGSLAAELPGKVTSVPDNSGLEFGPNVVTSFDVPRPGAGRAAVAPGCLF